MTTITSEQLKTYRGRYVTITKGMRGYFAVLIWWNPEGFWEPWDTGCGSYDNAEAAAPEAIAWAEDEDLPYLLGSHS